jgi:glycosyltransferase involved in cell wall biosynthesis
MQHLTRTRNIEVTAVIPVTDAINRIEILKVWLPDVSSDLPFEFLFILDSANRHESIIFHEFMERFEHLQYRIIETNAKSPGLARNLGIENSSSKWLCFWDSDDYPNPNAIYQELREINADINVVVGNFETINTEIPAEEKNISKDSSTKDIFTLNPGLWRFVFSRSIVGKLRFTKYKMAEDQLFLCSIALADQNILFSKLIFYTYVKHQYEQLTKSPEALLDLLPVQKLMIELVATQDKSNYKLTLFSLTRITLTGIKSLENNLKIKMAYSLMKFLINPKYSICFLLVFSSLIRRKAFN